MKDQIELVLVEDNKRFLKMSEGYLDAKLPEKVSRESFNRPEEALNWIKEEDVNVVVSDYDMPAMNGIELYEEALEIDPDLPFILYTGKGSEELAVEAWELGIDDYLRKGAHDSQDDTYEKLAEKILEYGQRSVELEKLDRLKPLGTSILNSDIPLMVVNEDTEITFANEFLLDELGYCMEELVGEKPSKIEDILEEEYSGIDEVIENNEVWTRGDVTFHGKNDEKYEAENYLIAKLSDHEEEFRVGIAYGFHQKENQ